jgi:hypothetical protein
MQYRADATVASTGKDATPTATADGEQGNNRPGDLI